VLLITNASGSLRTDLQPGDIVVIKDHINLPGLASLSPLFGLNDHRSPTAVYYYHYSCYHYYYYRRLTTVILSQNNKILYS